MNQLMFAISMCRTLTNLLPKQQNKRTNRTTTTKLICWLLLFFVELIFFTQNILPSVVPLVLCIVVRAHICCVYIFLPSTYLSVIYVMFCYKYSFILYFTTKIITNCTILIFCCCFFVFCRQEKRFVVWFFIFVELIDCISKYTHEI